MFRREYMDYHQDRFVDHSLVFMKNGQLYCVLSASEHGREIVSHGGLTYGGFVYDRMRLSDMLELCEIARQYYSDNGFSSLLYKAVPHIYHRHPAEEDLYALFRLGARLESCGPSAAIDLRVSNLPGKKLNGARRAERHGLSVRLVEDPAELILAIDRNLTLRHGTRVVHAPSEMQSLIDKHPGNIECFRVQSADGELMGGAIVYLCEPTVAHTQYLVVNEIGRPLRSMDLLISVLYERYRGRYQYLDFGISSENGGRILNDSLMSQKEGFGATVVCYNTFRLQWS